MELEEAIEKITDILSSVYDKGFHDGETKQAILELRGRDKFLENLRNGNNKEIQTDKSR